VIALLLDDPKAMQKIDASDMLSAIEKTPDRLKPPADAESTCHINVERPTVVVFGGLGGSGIAGDILADYCRDASEIPVMVSRSVGLQRFVGEGALFVAVSYSGDTQETLGMFQQAKEAHAASAIVTSGGRLFALAIEESVPYLKVTSGMPPRVALPELVAALVHLAGEAGVLKDSKGVLESASVSTRAVIDAVKVDVPLAQNPAKQVASSLFGRLPLLVGDEENGSVLRRFKNELNENSKLPAFCYILPEAYHNDIEGFGALAHLSNTQPIVLESARRNLHEELLREKLSETFSKFGYPPPRFFSGIGTDRLGWLISAITFGDFVSFYLAMLNGVDPSKLSLIPTFRALKGQV